MSKSNAGEKSRAAGAKKPSRNPADRKYLIASVLLHVILFSLIFASWKGSEPVQIRSVPQNIQARVITEQELQALRNKKTAEEEARQAKADAAKQKRLEQQRQRERERKARERKRQEAEAKKRAEAKRKAEALKIQKEKERKQEEKRRREEEAARKAAEEERQQELKEARKRREEQLAERLREAEEATRAEEAEAERLQQEALAAQRQQERQAYEISESERFQGLIKGKVENRWIVPPNTRDLTVLLHIRLLPNGELASVKIAEGSGNSALDRSALNAVQAVRRFPVPDDTEIFEKYFRSFNMWFKPPKP